MKPDFARMGLALGVGIMLGAAAHRFASVYEQAFPSHTVTLKVENPTGRVAYACVTDTRSGRTTTQTVQPGSSVIVPALHATNALQVQGGHVIVVTFDDQGPCALRITRCDSDPVSLGRLTVLPAPGGAQGGAP